MKERNPSDQEISVMTEMFSIIWEFSADLLGLNIPIVESSSKMPNILQSNTQVYMVVDIY